eukprot:5449937-Amphidinium_carterae.1
MAYTLGVQQWQGKHVVKHAKTNIARKWEEAYTYCKASTSNKLLFLHMQHEYHGTLITLTRRDHVGAVSNHCSARCLVRTTRLGVHMHFHRSHEVNCDALSSLLAIVATVIILLNLHFCRHTMLQRRLALTRASSYSRVSLSHPAYQCD